MAMAMAIAICGEVALMLMHRTENRATVSQVVSISRVWSTDACLGLDSRISGSSLAES